MAEPLAAVVSQTAGFRRKRFLAQGNERQTRLTVLQGFPKGRQQWQKNRNKHQHRVVRAPEDTVPAADMVALVAKAVPEARVVPAVLAAASANTSARRRSASFVSRRWTSSTTSAPTSCRSSCRSAARFF